MTLMLNSGQNCNAPSRMLVPAGRLDEVEALAAAALARVRVGDPLMRPPPWGRWPTGPVRAGAAPHRGRHRRRRKAGGRRAGRPEGIARGFFARPTIFSQ
jgi:acyl-CoA reductase-like NAD-dependent aldehyde dehydrogenase